MPYMVMEHEIDPSKKLLDELGDISDLVLFNNQVLVATYIRPQKTKSGIYLTEKHVDEDRFQSKVGLVIKKGPLAFDDETGQWFNGVKVELNDWIVHRPSDGWSITINNVPCRILDDTSVRGTIKHPDMVW